MGAGALLLSSMAFVGCSDDNDFPKNKLGASFIQSITAGTNYVDLRWTITPTDNVDGYKVQIYAGTIGNLGSEVASGTFDKKTPNGTFTGLQPDTHYVVATQCIPASGSKFNDADIAYFEFWTAPTTTITSVNVTDLKLMVNEDGTPVTKEEPVIGDDGEPVMKPVIGEDGQPVIGEDGEPVMEPEMKEIPLYEGKVTISWAENLNIQQVTNLYVYMADVDTDTQVVYFTTPAIGSGTTGTSYTFSVSEIVPGEKYYVEMWPNPSNYSWFTTASVTEDHYEFTMPSVN